MGDEQEERLLELRHPGRAHGSEGERGQQGAVDEVDPRPHQQGQEDPGRHERQGEEEKKGGQDLGAGEEMSLSRHRGLPHGDHRDRGREEHGDLLRRGAPGEVVDAPGLGTDEKAPLPPGSQRLSGSEQLHFQEIGHALVPARVHVAEEGGFRLAPSRGEGPAVQGEAHGEPLVQRIARLAQGLGHLGQEPGARAGEPGGGPLSPAGIERLQEPVATGEERGFRLAGRLEARPPEHLLEPRLEEGRRRQRTGPPLGKDAQGQRDAQGEEEDARAGRGERPGFERTPPGFPGSAGRHHPSPSRRRRTTTVVSSSDRAARRCRRQSASRSSRILAAGWGPGSRRSSRRRS